MCAAVTIPCARTWPSCLRRHHQRWLSSPLPIQYRLAVGACLTTSGRRTALSRHASGEGRRCKVYGISHVQLHLMW
eukprot:405471-Pyramimonas_sp.AAC.1